MRPFRLAAVAPVVLGSVLAAGLPDYTEAQRGPEAKERIQSGALLMSFGVEADDPREQLGAVTDAAFGPEGIVFLLDAPLGRVLVIGTDGRFVTSLGRPGDGPGEFRNPAAVAWLPDQGQLAVLDQAQGRVSLLTWRDGRLKFTTSFPVTPFAVDMCVVRNEIFVYAPSPSEEEVIQVFDLGGLRKRAFGSAFGAEGGSIMLMAKRGAALACLPGARSVALASQLDGEVRSWSEGGASLWRVRLPDLRPAKIRVSESGYGFDPSTPQPWDLVDALVPVGTDRFVVQVARAKRPPPAGEEPAEARFTFLLSAATGNVEGRTDSLPRIMSLSRDRLLTARSLPWPQVQLWGLTRMSP